MSIKADHTLSDALGEEFRTGDDDHMIGDHARLVDRVRDMEYQVARLAEERDAAVHARDKRRDTTRKLGATVARCQEVRRQTLVEVRGLVGMRPYCLNGVHADDVDVLLGD